MGKTWQESIQDAFSFETTGSHGTVSVGTAGTAIVVPNGSQSVLMQSFDQNARLVFAATGSGTATGFRITAAADPYLFVLGETLGTVHVTGEAASALINYQFLGRTGG